MAVLVLLLVLPGCGTDFTATVAPSQINPGDAFLVRVDGRGWGFRKPSAALSGNHLRFSSCGERSYLALGAVALGTKPGACVIKIASGRKEVELALEIKAAEWPETKLTLPDDKVSLSPKNEKRVNEENLKLKSVWKISSGKKWTGKFIMPLKNSLSTDFGVRRIINNRKTSIHRGVDIRRKEGEEIKASNSGRVVLTEEFFYGGNTVVLDHGLQIYTVYMHLSRFNVKAGDMVEKGGAVGYVGSTGRSTGPHLHFGVKVQDTSVNPSSLIGLDVF